MATPAIYVIYSKIVLDTLSVSKIKLNKCRRDFMIEIFMLYITWTSQNQTGKTRNFTEWNY